MIAMELLALHSHGNSDAIALHKQNIYQSCKDETNTVNLLTIISPPEPKLHKFFPPDVPETIRQTPEHTLHKNEADHIPAKYPVGYIRWHSFVSVQQFLS